MHQNPRAQERAQRKRKPADAKGTPRTIRRTQKVLNMTMGMVEVNSLAMLATTSSGHRVALH